MTLIYFFGSLPIFDTYRELAKIPKWAPYMKDVENFIAPYQDEERPDIIFKNLMSEYGFKNVHVELGNIDKGEDEIYHSLDKYKCK